jgi:hypothetical protein
MADDHPVLLCTDGSEAAQAAIVGACEFLAPGPAEALSIWMPAPVLHPHTKPTAILEYALLESAENVDTANEHAAQEAADAGRQLRARPASTARRAVSGRTAPRGGPFSPAPTRSMRAGS